MSSRHILAAAFLSVHRWHCLPLAQDNGRREPACPSTWPASNDNCNSRPCATKAWGCNLRYVVDVYGQAPRIELFPNGSQACSPARRRTARRRTAR